LSPPGPPLEPSREQRGDSAGGKKGLRAKRARNSNMSPTFAQRGAGLLAAAGASVLSIA